MGRKRARHPRPRIATRVIAEAKDQHGVIHVAQLRSLGVTSDRVRGWVEAGWLTRLHRGVYALPGPLTWRGRWHAAVLACGKDAVLSHASAAALWRLRKPREGAVDVTVVGYSGRMPRAGIRVHRSAVFPEGVRGKYDGIAVTAPARTIVDLAGIGITHRELERVVDEAERRRLCRAADLEREVRLNSRRRGCAEIRDLLAHHDLGSTLTRSELEERFLALCRTHSLPEPQVNVRLMKLTVDFLWPEVGLVVEVDGRASHGTDRAFQDDRDRDSMLTAAGFRVMRFTWWDVTRRPAVLADRLRKGLVARRP